MVYACVAESIPYFGDNAQELDAEVWGLGFGVWGLGFGVWGLGFGVWGLGFGVYGLWFTVLTHACRCSPTARVIASERKCFGGALAAA